ncbi:MAG: hypothetical protein EOO71_19725 [Myxococcaceae bacterium]|nr:MAG: hypothetical protein EOO71_19725 [Myxococcaceae bacterium]
MMETPPDAEQLFALALLLSLRAGGPSGVTARALEDSLLSVRPSSPDEVLREEQLPLLMELEPLPRLMLCLHQLRSVEGAPVAVPWASRFAIVAVQALYSLGRVELFPLRVTLLGTLLANSPSPRDTAELLFLRGNTRVSLAHAAPALLDAALQDIEAASEAARACDFTRVEVEAECLLAHSELLSFAERKPPSLEALAQRIARLEVLQARVATGSLVGNQEADLHEALYALENQRRVMGAKNAAARALHHARQSAALTEEPAVKALRWAQLAQLLHSEGILEEGALAARTAEEAMQRIPPGTGDIQVLQVHATLGNALRLYGRLAEAIEHLEQALRLLTPGGPTVNRNILRLQLTHAFSEVGRKDDARHHLEILFEEAHALRDVPALRAATRSLVRLDRDAGREQGAQERLLKAEARVAGTAAQTEFSLIRLDPGVSMDGPSEGFLALVSLYLAGRLQTDAQSDAQLERVIAHHTGALPSELRRRLLAPEGSILRDVELRARLLHAEGRQAESLDLLREVLASSREPMARLRASALLISLLPADAHEERLRVCDEVEMQLEGPRDLPLIRVDLARALRLSARMDAGLLERAWRHAERAAGQLVPGSREDLFNTRTRAAIRMDQLTLQARVSSPVAWELAGWFLEDRRLPEAELASHRCEAARRLLSPGPLTHPEGLALAERLLALGRQGANATGLGERLRWIRSCLESSLAPPARPETVPALFHGRFDLVPGWLVALAQGDVSRLARTPGLEDRDLAATVLQVRPDRTEAVLNWLFSLDSEGRGLDALAAQVGQSPPGVPLDVLRERVEQLVAQKPSYRLLRLRASLWRGGGAAYTRAVDALLAHARTAEERVESLRCKAVERMDQRCFEEAPPLLEAALREVRSYPHDPRDLFAVLLNLGNALRRIKAPEIARALALYSEADALNVAGPMESAQLWKLTADALLERREVGDALQALTLLERSLEVRRTGYLRVETLLSASRAEREQHGQDDLSRNQRALDRLDEAERLAEGEYRRMIASEQVQVLARLLRIRPGDASRLTRLDALGHRHPELAPEITRARRGVTGLLSDGEIEVASLYLFHPAGRAFSEATQPLRTVDLSQVEQMARRLGGNPDEVRKRVEEELRQEDRSPRTLRARADQLVQVTEVAARPGAAVGRARLLAHVAEWGLARQDEVVHAFLEAEQLLQGIPEKQARLLLRLELAHVWAPVNHYSHPVRDFGRAAEMARSVRDESPVGGDLSRLALQMLARATRYRPEGDLAANLREAEALFEQCLREYQAVGAQDEVAHVRTLLADVRASKGAGDTVQSLREGITSWREQLKNAGSPQQQAQARLDLALRLTQLGCREPAPQRRPLLLEAREEFEKLDRSLLTLPSHTHSADNYRTLCLAQLARDDGRPEEAIGLWRQRRASLGVDVPEGVRAYTTHNLADALLHLGSAPSDWWEGLALSEESLLFRTLERDPQHHWETCENIGRGALRLLVHFLGPGTATRAVTRQVWEQGRKALRGALAAARKQQSHERLFQSAASLLELASVAPSLASFELASVEGWGALDEARPYLLLDDVTGAEEARLAAGLARSLAHRLATRDQGGRAPGPGFVLSEESSNAVLGWVVRAAGATQRRLAARTSRPEAMPPSAWMDWRSASRSGDVRIIGRALDALRCHVPGFLRGLPDLQGTWDWLRTHTGSAVVAVVGGGEELLAAILTHDERPRVVIASLDVGAPPHDEDAVARAISERGGGEAYRALQEWATQRILTPLMHLMPRVPTQLLWVPTGVLRVLAPADLWPSVPVTCAVRLDLETQSAPPRARRTLLVVADPGPASTQSLPGSVELGASLAQQAQALGPLRVRMSRGAAWGKALGILCPELIEGPASPGDLLRDLAEVDVVLLLCHGEVDGPQDARLVLVDGAGRIAHLTLQQLAEDPHLVVGTTFVLLSCETGRVGDWLHRASGLAGALLAGRAKNVIAPLWPVLLEPAWEVGRAMLEALAAQGELSEVLLGLNAPERGPALGRRVDASQRQQEKAWSLKAFVRWVG